MQAKTYVGRLNYNEELIVDMPLTDNHKKGNAEGWLRDRSFYFKEIMSRNPDAISIPNQLRIKSGYNIKVDETFIKAYPEYAPFLGDKLFHHHIGDGRQAIAIPAALHIDNIGIHTAEDLSGITKAAKDYSDFSKKKILENPKITDDQVHHDYITYTELNKKQYLPENEARDHFQIYSSERMEVAKKLSDVLNISSSYPKPGKVLLESNSTKTNELSIISSPQNTADLKIYKTDVNFNISDEIKVKSNLFEPDIPKVPMELLKENLKRFNAELYTEKAEEYDGINKNVLENSDIASEYSIRKLCEEKIDQRTEESNVIIEDVQESSNVISEYNVKEFCEGTVEQGKKESNIIIEDVQESSNVVSEYNVREFCEATIVRGTEESKAIDEAIQGEVTAASEYNVKEFCKATVKRGKEENNVIIEDVQENSNVESGYNVREFCDISAETEDYNTTEQLEHSIELGN